MDINVLRGIATLLLFFAFVGMCFWVYSSKRRKVYEDAANQPFLEDGNK